MDSSTKKIERDTLRRPVQIVKKRSGPLENVLSQLSQSEEADILNTNTQVPPAVPVAKITTTSFFQKRRPTTKEKEKKRERWLLTRKTWKYMTEAGRKLISDGMHNSKEDIPKIEAYFNEICENEQNYILWRRKLSYPGGMRHSKRRLKKLLRHSGSFKPNSSKDDSQNTAEIIELLQSYLHLDNNYKTATLLGSKTVRPDQTISPSARRPVNNAKNNSISASSAVDSQTISVSADEDYEKRNLYERICQLGKKNPLLSGILASSEITSTIMDDKESLKKIYIALKKQQMHLMLDTHSQPHVNLKHSISLSSLHNFDNFFKFDSSTKTKNPISHMHSTSRTKNFPSVTEFSLKKNTASTKGRKNSLSNTKTVYNENLIFQSNTYQNENVSLASHRKQQITKQHLNTSGTQTTFIPLQEIRALAEEYKMRKQEESGEFSPTQNAESANVNYRKSSIDNEDVSQSVSDTIKRYLRMARKKSVHEDNANRFKRVNYDRNLRNIRAKGEINPPGLDEGNNKATQTLDAWPLIQLEFIRGIENSNLLDIAHSDWEKQLNERTQKQLQYGQNSKVDETTNSITSSTRQQSSSKFAPSSLPTSPTSVKSSNQTAASIFSSADCILKPKSQTKSLESIITSKAALHNKEDDKHFHQTNVVLHIPGTQNNICGIESINMQKSKSSSNVGLYVTRKFTKRRSKSQSRTESNNAKWSPADNFCWMSEDGKKILLNDTKLQNLCGIESRILKTIAVQKINELNVGIVLKADNYNKSQNRVPFLKKKSGTTSFFDIGIKDEGGGSGNCTFGISLERCILNDQKQGMSSPTSTSEPGSRSSISSLFSLHKSSNDSQHNKGSKQLDCSVESLPSSFLSNYSDYCEDSVQQAQSEKKINMKTNEDEVAHDEREKLVNSTMHVPQFVSACLENLEMNGLDKVGLFRVSTSKKRVRQMREEIDKNGKYEFDIDTCPHDVATLLKEFLRDLPEPLLCNKLYKPFLDTQRIRNRRLQLETISHLIKLLPDAHRDTLYVILEFLAKVAARADDLINDDGEMEICGNKMDSYNLATVFAPNILRSNSKTTRCQNNEQDAMLNAINVTRIMIDHYAEMFTVPAELIHIIYSNLLDECPEDLYQLCNNRCTTSIMGEPRSSSDEEKIKGDAVKLYSRESILHQNDAATASTNFKSTHERDSGKKSNRKRVTNSDQSVYSVYF